MKKISLVFASLLIVSMIFAGCKKDSAAPDSGNGGNEPLVTHYLTYHVDNRDTINNHVMPNCFKFNVTYFTSETDSVVVTNVSLPWTSPKIELPHAAFTAKFRGVLVYNEDELPDTSFYAGYAYGIFKDVIPVDGKQKYLPFSSKDKFLEYVASHPDGIILSFNARLLLSSII